MGGEARMRGEDRTGGNISGLRRTGWRGGQDGGEPTSHSRETEFRKVSSSWASILSRPGVRVGRGGGEEVRSGGEEEWR